VKVVCKSQIENLGLNGRDDVSAAQVVWVRRRVAQRKVDHATFRGKCAAAFFIETFS
jgi:hypothetical protein